jgi:hypothetical protein
MKGGGARLKARSGLMPLAKLIAPTLHRATGGGSRGDRRVAACWRSAGDVFAYRHI